VNSADVEIVKEYGKGSLGTLFEGSIRLQKVAVKKLFPNLVDNENIAKFESELQNISLLRNPNIVLFMGASVKEEEVMILTELAPRSLAQVMSKKPQCPPFKTRMNYAKYIALGMQWLHTNNPPFIHRDLNASNVLVLEDGTIKITDFAFSFMKDKLIQKDDHGFGDKVPKWLAPEVLKRKPYTHKADSYSFGLLLWQLLTRDEPYKNITTTSDLISKIVDQQERPEIPNICPKKLKGYIVKCLDEDPENRPDFEEILLPPSFDEIVLEALINIGPNYDKKACGLWKKNFLTKDGLLDVVSWSSFAEAFHDYEEIKYKRDDIRFKCLQAMVEKNGQVTIESFATTLQRFGPLKDFSSFLDKLITLLKNPWFHGNIDANKAEEVIMSAKRGTFLVRFSSDPGSYTITSKSKSKKLKHFRILHKAGLDFLIGKVECKSLEDIITRFGDPLFLKHPCLGSPYAYLFAK